MADWTDESRAELHGVGYAARGEVSLPAVATVFGFPESAGGPAGAATNSPESFLAAAAASCWLLTFAVVAERMRIEVIESRAVARVHVVPDGRGLKVESVRVEPTLRIRGDAATMADKMRRVCELSSRGCVIEKAVTPGVSSYSVEPTIEYVAAG